MQASSCASRHTLLLPPSLQIKTNADAQLKPGTVVHLPGCGEGFCSAMPEHATVTRSLHCPLRLGRSSCTNLPLSAMHSSLLCVALALACPTTLFALPAMFTADHSLDEGWDGMGWERDEK